MIRQDQSKKKLRLLAFGAGALFLLAAGGGVATYVSLDREAEARQARHDRELKDAEERLKRARDEQAGAAAEIERLTKAAAEAKDQVTRDKVARDLEAAQRKKKAADSAVHQQSEAKPSLPGGHECPPGSLDPLCVSKP
jgi:septal ring factor EnvC (AmiA/AmiB activator)